MNRPTDASPEDVAAWMLKELDRQKYLYQADVVYEIEKRFGEQFVYDNQNGNRAIDGRVLKAFRTLTGDTVVWERGQRMWRRREKYDEGGRRQY